MPAQALAQRRGQLAVPALQHLVEPGAVEAPGAGDEHGPERLLEPPAGPGGERIGLAAGDAESAGEFVGGEVLAQAQLDDLALVRRQPGDRRADQFAHLGLLQVNGEAGRVAGHLVLARCPGPCRQPAAALAACHGEQPRLEAVPVLEACQPCAGDDERVLHRVGGVSGLGQQRAAECVQRRCVPVVRRREPVSVAGHHRGDDRAVQHATHLRTRTAYRAGRTYLSLLTVPARSLLGCAARRPATRYAYGVR